MQGYIVSPTLYTHYSLLIHCNGYYLTISTTTRHMDSLNADVLIAGFSKALLDNKVYMMNTGVLNIVTAVELAVEFIEYIHISKNIIKPYMPKQCKETVILL